MVINDVYTLRDVAPGDEYHIETALSHLEAEVAPIMRDIIEHRTVEYGDHPARKARRTSLSSYLAYQISRSTAFKAHSIEAGNEYFRKDGIEEVFMTGAPDWVDDKTDFYEAIASYISGDRTYEDNHDGSLDILFSVGSDIAPILRDDFRWVLVSNPNHSNITADMPIACLSRNNVDGYLWQLGLDNIGNIWFPLSPSHAILLTKAHDCQSEYLVGHPEVIERWNRILWQRADRWVIWQGDTAAGLISAGC